MKHDYPGSVAYTATRRQLMVCIVSFDAIELCVVELCVVELCVVELCVVELCVVRLCIVANVARSTPGPAYKLDSDQGFQTG